MRSAQHIATMQSIVDELNYSGLGLDLNEILGDTDVQDEPIVEQPKRELVTVATAAAKVGKSVQAINRAVRDGKIDSYEGDGPRKVDLVEVEAYYA